MAASDAYNLIRELLAQNWVGLANRTTAATGEQIVFSTIHGAVPGRGPSYVNGVTRQAMLHSMEGLANTSLKHTHYLSEKCIEISAKVDLCTRWKHLGCSDLHMKMPVGNVSQGHVQMLH